MLVFGILLFRLPVDRRVRIASVKQQPSSSIEKLISVTGWLLSVSFVWIFLCKCWNGRVLFMLMPCHVLTSLLFLLLASNPQSERAAAIYNVYLSYSFMPVLAVAFPDLRDYQLPFERVCFFVQHAAMIALPILFAAQRRFPVYASRTWAVRAYALGALAFFGFLVPLSAATGTNLNYMMSPPPGILRMFGKAYRPVQMVFCSILLASVNWFHKSLVPSLVQAPTSSSSSSAAAATSNARSPAPAFSADASPASASKRSRSRSRSGSRGPASDTKSPSASSKVILSQRYQIPQSIFIFVFGFALPITLSPCR